jgi:spore protease
MIVTPRDIDARVREISRLIGYGMNLALHDGLTIEEIPCFLA